MFYIVMLCVWKIDVYSLILYIVPLHCKHNTQVRHTNTQIHAELFRNHHHVICVVTEAMTESETETQ